MAITKDYVLQFAAKRHITTSETLYWTWYYTNDESPPPPAGYEGWTLEQMAEWIAEHYAGANLQP